MTASLEQEIRSLQEIQGSEQDPGGRAFVHLADARRRNGELDEALEILAEGLARHPDFSSAHVVAGWVYRDRGEEGEAAAAFKRVMELDEENTAALRGLGEVAAARGDLEEALRWLKKLAGLVPEDRELADRIDDLEREQLAAEAEVFSELDGIMTGEGEAAGDADEFARMDSMGDESDLGEILTMEDEPEAGVALPEPEDEAPALEAEELALAEEPALETDAADDEDWEPDEEEDGEVFTETMGELYARQGLLDRAVEVFERLVEERPDETRLQERLADLREEAAGKPAGAPSDRVVGAAAESEEAVETLAREMSSGEGAAGALDTPFAWEEDEEAPRAAAAGDESGGPITSYFDRLLAWEPEAEAGLPAAGGRGSEPVPIESLAPGAGAGVGPGAGAPGAEPVPVESLAPDAGAFPAVETTGSGAAGAPAVTLDEDDEGPEPVVVIAESSGESAEATDAEGPAGVAGTAAAEGPGAEPVTIESLAPDSTAAVTPDRSSRGAPSELEPSDVVPIESLAPDTPSDGTAGGGPGAVDEAGDGSGEGFGHWLERLQ